MCVLLLFKRDSHLFCLATGVKTPPPSQSVRASFSSEMSTCHSDQSHMNSWRLDLKWVHTDVLIMQMLRQDSSFCVSHNKSIITISIHSLSILLLTRTNYNRQLHIWRCRHPVLKREDRLGKDPFAGFGTLVEDITGSGYTKNQPILLGAF